MKSDLTSKKAETDDSWSLELFKTEI